MPLSSFTCCVAYGMIKSGAVKGLLGRKGPKRPSGKGNFLFTFELPDLLDIKEEQIPRRENSLLGRPGLCCTYRWVVTGPSALSGWGIVRIEDWGFATLLFVFVSALGVAFLERPFLST